MVRATRRILSWARAERPSSLTRPSTGSALVVQAAELAGLARGHVGVVPRSGPGETLFLNPPRRHHLLAHLRAAGARRRPDSLNGTAGTSMWMSIRSSSGPLIFAMYLRSAAACNGNSAAGRRDSRRGTDSRPRSA